MLVMAIWWLATHHAILELTGLMSDGKSEVAYFQDEAGHTHERWHLAEKAATKQKSNLHDLADLSVVVVFLYCAPFLVLPRSRAPLAWRHFAHRTFTWLPSWDFTRRTAPVPQAP